MDQRAPISFNKTDCAHREKNLLLISQQNQMLTFYTEVFLVW